MILVLFVLTPFTMANTLSIFYGFRVAQTRLIFLSIVHGLKPKIEGNFGRLCQSQSLLGLNSRVACPLFEGFFPSQLCVHKIHTHQQHATKILHWNGFTPCAGQRIQSFTQISSAHSRQARAGRTCLGVNIKISMFGHQSLFSRADRTTRSLELALIQEWQPRLNYPFICQFFRPKKGLLKRPAMNANAQFGLATLWRCARHRSTPQIVKDILASDRFQNRIQLRHIIHDLSSNTEARFEMTKFLRSTEGGVTLCYALRRLSANIQEPYRTFAIQAIDSTLAW